MYDPRYPNPFHFPELDDPRFWADIAAQTGVPPTYQQWSPGPGHIVPPSPTFYEVQPIEVQPIVVESWLVPAPQTSALVPYQAPSIPICPPPADATPRSEQQETNAPAQKQSSGFMQLILWGIVIFLIGSLISSTLGSKPTPAPSGPPNTSYSLFGNPSVSGEFIDQVLKHYGSPAEGKGQTLYALGTEYGVDPVFALAFFMHESSFGKAGVARYTHSLSNMRCVPQYDCYHDPVNGDYASFPTWEQGFEAWYKLVTGPTYKGAGLTTVDSIIPRYAPSVDNNNEAAYIAFLKEAVDSWRAGRIEVAA